MDTRHLAAVLTNPAATPAQIAQAVLDTQDPDPEIEARLDAAAAAQGASRGYPPATTTQGTQP